MLPQIPLLSTPAPSSGASVPLMPTTGDAPRLGHPVVGVSKATNFAAIFAADMPRLQKGTADDLADTPEPDTEVSDGTVEPSTQKHAPKRAETDEESQKVPSSTVEVATVPENDGLPASKPNLANTPRATGQVGQADTALTNSAELADPTGTTQAKSPTVADPWQVAVLPKGSMPVVPPKPSDALNAGPAMRPEPWDLATPQPTAVPGGPLVESTTLSDNKPTARDPFVARLTAEFAPSTPDEQRKLVARFAEPLAPLIQNNTQTPVQPVATPPVVVPTDQGAIATVTAAATNAAPLVPLGSDRPGVPTPGAAPLPQSTTTTPLATPAIPGQKYPAPVATGQVPHPSAAPVLSTTSLGTPTIADGSPQTVQTPQSSHPAPHLQTQNPIAQIVTVAKSPPPSELERRITARFEPVVQPTVPSTTEVTKLAAPLVPWQAVALAPSEPITAKDTLAIDPISGEPRLTSLTAQNTQPNAPQRADLPPQIARQLAEAIQQNPNRPVEIILKPQELGAVRLSVQQAEAGIIVSLTAERPETLDLMRRHIDQLGQEFQAMGYANIAFSFAGSDAGTESQTDDAAASGAAESDDGSTMPAAQIHLATGTTGGVDLRL